MAAGKDVQARFAYLLQPIRDLTKNWEVDVAAQLEEYIEEIEQITISFDGGTTTMNFAEAALLIQGTTCVYSKKVEYLYALVYQTLDLLSSKRKLTHLTSMVGDGKDKDISFAQEENFLALDDITESTNIDLVEQRNQDSGKSVATIPRTPLSLLPLHDTERATHTPLLSPTGEVLGSRLDFKMNTSVVHSSGALLLEPLNQLVIEVKVHGVRDALPIRYDTPTDRLKGFLSSGSITKGLPPPPDDYDDDSIGGIPMDEGGGPDFGGCYGDDVEPHLPRESYIPALANNEQGQPSQSRPRRVRMKEEEEEEGEEGGEDPWRLLDPHEPCPNEHRPFKRGQTFRLLPSLKGDAPTRKRRRQPAQSHSTEPLAQFILNAFYSCSELFPKSRLKAPLSSEFEALFWAELKARNVRKRKENHSLSRLKKQSVLQLEQDVLTEAGDDGLDDYQPLGAQGADGDSDDDGRADQSSFTLPGLEAGFEGAFHGFTEGHPPPPSHTHNTSFQGVGPIALDDSWSQRGGRQTGGAVVQSYEELVRNYVESTMAAVLMYVQETELSKRVANWEDRIKPRLLAEERHTAFDIHQYGASVLSEFASRRCQLRTDKLLFREIALNKEQFEVCRLFAATLQLANDCNVEISSVASEERGAGAMDIMQLVLLSTRMAHETVSNYQVPSHAQQK